MHCRKLGKSGLKVSELGYGSYLTLGYGLDVSSCKNNIKYAFDKGINLFDNAEVYAEGVSESIMGEAIKIFRREEIVLTTKIFWESEKANWPNLTGLSRKHILEGTRNSLKRLQVDYVDLIYCHRYDPETPMEEVVLAMNYVIRSGMALYWGTSEWPQEKIEAAYQTAKELGCIPPTMEQPFYCLLYREKVENELADLCSQRGLGLTTWGPLAMGLLTGKYNQGIPAGSRLDKFKDIREASENAGWLKESVLQKIQDLEKIAKSLEISLAQLSLAWCLKNKNVSSVLVGARTFEQLQDNIKSAEIAHKLTLSVMKEIFDAVSNIEQNSVA